MYYLELWRTRPFVKIAAVEGCVSYMEILISHNIHCREFALTTGHLRTLDFVQQRLVNG